MFLSETPHYLRDMTAETDDYIYDEVNDQVYKSEGSTNKDQGTDSKVYSILMTDV